MAASSAVVDSTHAGERHRAALDRAGAVRRRPRQLLGKELRGLVVECGRLVFPTLGKNLRLLEEGEAEEVVDPRGLGREVEHYPEVLLDFVETHSRLVVEQTEPRHPGNQAGPQVDLILQECRAGLAVGLAIVASGKGRLRFSDACLGGSGEPRNRQGSEKTQA